MKEVKSPKKPLIFYYGIALLVIVLFNVIVSPLLVKARVTEVDYGTFMSMIEQKKIGNVEVEDDQIIFTDKDDAKKIYKTGAMNDPTLTQRLYDSGAKFSKDIETTTSPLVSFLLTFCAPADNLHRTRPVYGQEADGTGGRQKPPWRSASARATRRSMSRRPRAYISATLQVRTRRKRAFRR